MRKKPAAPRVVRVLRFVTKFVSFSLFLGFAGYFYTTATKPYNARYFVSTSRTNANVFDVSVYSYSGTATPNLLRLGPLSDNLVDVTFRPLEKDMYQVSLREIFGSLPEAKPFLPSHARISAAEVADRHLPLGLAGWETLRMCNLRSRVRLYLRIEGNQLSPEERGKIEDQFMSLPDRHRVEAVILPKTLQLTSQLRLRAGLDRIEQEWERDVSTVVNAWLQRWQTLTGTTLLPPQNGLGGLTPVYLFLPTTKEESEELVGIETGPFLDHPPDISIHGPEIRKVKCAKRLKWWSIRLAMYDHPWKASALILVFMISLIVFFTYQSWPKREEDVEVFRKAQQYRDEELWSELHSRNPWVDSDIVEHFLVRGAGLPGAEVIKYFWSMVTGTLNIVHVPARTSDEVERVIRVLLRQALRNVIP